MRNHFTKWLLAAFTIVALVGGGVAYAQEQVGSIEGVVADKDGAALPGVTVAAVSAAGATFTAVTDAKGAYKYPSLRPDVYKLTASLQGFAPAEVTGVSLALGKTLKVNFTLNPGTFEETITVTADTVVIDVTKSATAVSLRSETLDMLPKGRDFSTVVGMAPGAGQESWDAQGNTWIQVDGASGSENKFIIDGVDTSSPQKGVQGQNLIVDFVDEVQVKTAGYNAEYGGSLGGVINAITKSGGNNFSGSVGLYYTDRSWGGQERPTNYEAWCDQSPDCTRQFQEDDRTALEPGFSLGGPILKDKMWFFVAYQPSMTDITRVPDGQTTQYDQTDDYDYATANLKGSIGSSFMYKLAGNYSTRMVEGVLSARDGTTPAATNLAIDNEYPNYSYSLYMDFVASESFLMSGRAGYFMMDQNTSGVTDTTRFFFRNGTIPVSQSDPLYRPTGWSSIPAGSFNATQFDKWERQAAGLDATIFFDLLGSHQVKFGGQYEVLKNEVASGENGNLFEIRWGLPDRFGSGVQGTYGSVHVRRFGTFGAVESQNASIFLQDSWAITPNFTLNFGVRADQEKVPNYGRGGDPTLDEYFFQWDFGDKIAPRIGFAWDVMNDQKLKVYGSWGTYYDIMKLELPRGSYGGERWIAYLYPLNTTNWTTLNAGCTISTNNAAVNPCPGLGTPTTRDLRHATNPSDPVEGVDPNLKPMENEEWQLGAEYLLGPNSVVGVRYVNKTLINTIEDIGYLICEDAETCNEVYITGNPGKGIVAGDPDGDGPVPAQAEAIRDYQALELSYGKRFADNWMLRATYTYSELEGNYSGLASSDESGRLSPNVNRYFDGLVFGFDDQGNLVSGALNTDRPHAIEIQGAYRFNFGLNIGINTSYRSGGAVSTDAVYNGVNFFPRGRNNLGRLGDITQTELYLAQPIKLGGLELEVNLNVSNLFDEDTITQVDNVAHDWDVCDTSADCDYSYQWYFGQLVPYNYFDHMAGAGAAENPSYRKPLNWQAPRSVRLGVKLTF